MTRLGGAGVKLSVGLVLVMLAVLAVLVSNRGTIERTLPAASSSAPGKQGSDASPVWLEVVDGESPVDFIARTSGAPADQIAPILDRATEIYRESPRMIANRSVQLWQEIGEKQVEPVGMLDLLRDLSPADGVAASDSLGTVVQHYRVLRSRGGDHASAIAIATGGQR